MIESWRAQTCIFPPGPPLVELLRAPALQTRGLRDRISREARQKGAKKRRGRAILSAPQEKAAAVAGH